VTVIHSIASAQSRVATLHHIVHELLVFLVVPVVIEVLASVLSRGALREELGAKPSHFSSRPYRQLITLWL